MSAVLHGGSSLRVMNYMFTNLNGYILYINLYPKVYTKTWRTERKVPVIETFAFPLSFTKSKSNKNLYILSVKICSCANESDRLLQNKLYMYFK